MSILPLMILVSMVIVVGAGIAFFWAVEHDQFEDLQSPGFLPLLDDAAPDAQADRPAASEPAQDGPNAPPARTAAGPRRGQA